MLAMPLPTGTVESWASDYILALDLEHKLSPPPLPSRWEEDNVARRLASPGRPSCLTIARKSQKTPGREALRDPRRRAQVFHTFLHHELQAAELMLWALLAFPETPRAFRKGLLGIVS